MLSETTGIVLIVDEETSDRTTLATALQAELLSVRSFSTAAECLAGTVPEQAGCLICSAVQGDDSSFNWLAILRSRGYKLPVLVTAKSPDASLVLQAWKGTASGVLLKPFELAIALPEIRAALAHDHEYRLRLARKQQTQERLATLTDKEHRVLELVMRSEPNKAMAMQLGISERAVEMRRAAVMKKLGAESLVDLVRLMTHYELSR